MVRRIFVRLELEIILLWLGAIRLKDYHIEINNLPRQNSLHGKQVNLILFWIQ